MMGQKAVIADTILSTLYYSNCLSRNVLNFLPFHPTATRKYLTSLKADKYIQQLGVGRDKLLIPTLKGYEHLQGLNAIRYPHVDRRIRYDRSDRAGRLGDTIAVLAVNGFSVHADDKPPFGFILPTIASYNDEDYKKLFQNSSPYTYGNSPDTATYQKRDTCINCFYPSLEIKHYYKQEENMLRTCRLSGLLLTPSYLLRIYHTGTAAMRLRPLLEQAASQRLFETCGGYLPEKKESILILGTRDFTGAKKIFSGELNTSEKWKDTNRKRTVESLLSPYNLGSPSFYLPLSKWGVHLLGFYQFPEWDMWLTAYARENLFEEFTPYKRSVFNGESKGRRCYAGFTLNLTDILKLIQQIRYRSEQPLHIACFDWQKEFYTELLEEYTGFTGCEVTFTTIDFAVQEKMLELLQDYWNGGIHA